MSNLAHLLAAADALRAKDVDHPDLCQIVEAINALRAAGVGLDTPVDTPTPTKRSKRKAEGTVEGSDAND